MIRTEDREQMRRDGVHVRKVDLWNWTAACPACSWPRGRTFATESGAVNRLAEHMAASHRLKLTLRPTPPARP